MKTFKKILAVVLALVCVGTVFAGCSSNSNSTNSLTIAVEKGSAGEAEAQNLTDSVVSMQSQAKAIQEVKAGTADACIIDSTMANSLTKEGSSFDDLGYTLKLTTEVYAIGFRKGSDMTAKVNAIIDELSNDGTLKTLSDKYGIDLAEDEKASENEVSLNEYDNIVKKGKLVVGVTDYEPIDYKDENGEWTGFDADFARAVAAKMGVEVEFVEIDWDNKFIELESGTIDCIWNGMTVSDSVTTNCDISKPYAGNSQVVVMKKDRLADYSTVEAIKGE